MRILISGAGGFLAGHLIRELAPGNELIGADLPGAKRTSGCEWVEVGGGAELAAAVHRIRPELLIHAAFLNRKPPPWTEQHYLEDMLSVNLPLFKTCAALDIGVLLVSSSAVYGSVHGHQPIREDSPRRPVSLYGLAKAMQEMSGEYFGASQGLRLLVARLFNLVGPGQAAGMLLPDWLIQLRQIENGGEPVLKVRHQATRRDFVDVRDASVALSTLAEDFRPGEVVNVACERGIPLSEIVKLLRSLCSVPFEVLETQSAPGKDDIDSQCGSARKLRQGWGWNPQIDWRQSVEDSWQAIRL